MLLPALNQARDKAKSAACISNLKQCGLGMLSYATDYDEYLPGQVQRLKSSAGQHMSNAETWSGLLAVNSYCDGKYTVRKKRPDKVPAIFSFGSNSVFACPALRSSAHTVENQSFAPGEVSSKSTYGVRTRMGGNIFDGDIWVDPYVGTSNANYNWILNIKRINTRLPYLSDTAHFKEGILRQADAYSVSNLYVWSPAMSGIDLRHSKKSNHWMPDGSVRSFNQNELILLDGNPSNGKIISISFNN